MNDIIKKQILAIRETGETNMFDIRVVTDIAFREGYVELLEYLANRKSNYIHFILTGEDKI